MHVIQSCGLLARIMKSISAAHAPLHAPVGQVNESEQGPAWSTETLLFPGYFRQFMHQKLTRTNLSRGEGAEKRKQRRREGMDDCRPLGFLIGLPFAVLALALSLVGAVVWLLGTILGCLCPCCICFSGLANLAVALIKMPVNVIRWFVRQIPC